MDGLRVPLVVYDPDEPFEYDQDEIITVSGRLDLTQPKSVIPLN